MSTYHANASEIADKRRAAVMRARDVTGLQWRDIALKFGVCPARAMGIYYDGWKRWKAGIFTAPLTFTPKGIGKARR